MKINKILALLLAVIMLLSVFTGCNTTKPDGADPSGSVGTGEYVGSDETGTTNGSTDTTSSDPAGNETISGTENTNPETKPAQPSECSHNWSNWTTKKAVTCTADGSEERTCSKCNEKEQRTATATGHKWDSGKETGSNIAYTCTVCGSTKTEQLKGNHTYGEWKWEEYTFKHSSGGTYTSHRKYRTCTKCGYKEVSGSDHICQKGSDNHTVTTVKAGTCTTKATMRSTCKVCGWYVEYEGSKGKHTINTETRHLTDYGTYTNELDTVVSECTSCGTKEVSYTYGQGFSDYNRYRNTIVLNQGSAFASRSPSGADFLAHPTWQTVIRDYKYDSEGYVKQFTVYWHDTSGNRYSYVVDCTPEHLASWFAEYGLTGGSGYKYQLKISGNKVVPYKVSWTS